MYDDFGKIDVTVVDGVFTIKIDGLDNKTHSGLARVFRAAHESDADVVVVTGKSRSFLSPEQYDFEWVQSLSVYDSFVRVVKEAEDIIRDQLNCEKVMIAKVYAPGAHSLGASIALGCDFVFASDDATFSDPHMSGFGVPPGDGGALLWPARIGMTRAKEFLLTDKACTAKEAVDIGLINRAVPSDDLDSEVEAFVKKLQSQNQLGLRMSKKWLNQYMQLYMNVCGAGTLAAEAMVLASSDFATNAREFGESLAD